MAVTTSKLSTALTLRVKSVDLNGKDVIKNLKLSKLKVDATDANIYDVAQAMAALLKNTLVGVLRDDISEIENQK